MTSALIVDITFSSSSSSSNELKQAIAQNIISKHHKISIIKSKQRRYIVKCCNDNCKQRPHILQFHSIFLNEFVIRTYVSIYTNIGAKHLDNQYARTSWVESKLKNKLKEISQYKVVDILKYI